MASSGQVRTSFYIISDTHDGRSSSQLSQHGAFRKPFPRCDVLLNSGDLTMTGQLHEYESSIQFLQHYPAELKLVIAGNHDLSLDHQYWENNPEAVESYSEEFSKEAEYDGDLPRKARALWTSQLAKDANIHYLEEGLHTFTLSNGAVFTIYASPWQPEFCNWAFNYPHDEDRWNPAHLVEGSHAKPAPKVRDPHPIPEGAEVDIVMTHGPAQGHLDLCNHGGRVGCPHLLSALDRVRPRIHCCGHIHEAWGAERVSWSSDGSDTGAKKRQVLAGSKGGSPRLRAALADDIIQPRHSTVIAERGVHLDLSDLGDRPLRHKEETLFVNASIVNLYLHAANAGFLVDLDLPRTRA